MVSLVNMSVGGGALMWMGFAHFDHVEASANLYAHAILALRAPLTSDMAWCRKVTAARSPSAQTGPNTATAGGKNLEK